ncbi:MAG: hypothetical protein Q4F54_05315 [Coriobacteriia bacterium]|nr:hypothetical protein [Coriobacteriia bacterium]
MYVAGYNPAGFSGEGRKVTFGSTYEFRVTGSLGTLIDFTKESVTAVPNDLCFQYLFANCTHLTKAPIVNLTFTDNEDRCYNHMFSNCSSLEFLEVDFTS